jgi:very-short-patch-repair endonuclease
VDVIWLLAIPMKNDEPSGCLFVLLDILGLAPKSRSTNSTLGTELPYRCKNYLLTQAERAFYDVLRPTVGTHFHLFAMVRLADLIYIEKGTANRQSHFNRIQSKHIDFVLCDNESIKPVLAIELDDSSHQRPDRQKRDAFVDEVLLQAGLPLLRVQVRRQYDPNQLRQAIKNALATGAR